jgi:hypothetical protein
MHLDDAHHRGFASGIRRLFGRALGGETGRNRGVGCAIKVYGAGAHHVGAAYDADFAWMMGNLQDVAREFVEAD